MTNQNAKHDKGKPKYHLIEPIVIEQLAKVLTFGADKYGSYSWKKVDDAKNRYYSALMRHLESWRQGESKDEESGLHHLSHVITNAHFLLYNDMKGNVANDEKRVGAFIDEAKMWPIETIKPCICPHCSGNTKYILYKDNSSTVNCDICGLNSCGSLKGNNETTYVWKCKCGELNTTSNEKCLSCGEKII